MTASEKLIREWFDPAKAAHRDFLRDAWADAAPGTGRSDHEAAWERFARIAWECVPALLHAAASGEAGSITSGSKGA